MAVKVVRIKCKQCGVRAPVVRGERGFVSAYCDTCRAERTREQARQRMRALRQRRF